MENLTDFYKERGITCFEGHSQQNLKETEFLKSITSKEDVKNVMEIGFNAGHSAETFLLSNKHVNLVSFDVGIHAYVQLGKEFIDSNYPSRHKLIIGNSLVAVPKYASDNPDITFDIIFIDGGHDYTVSKGDIINCKKLANENTIVIMDDTMNNKAWINYWNEGPNRAWSEAKEWNFVKELGTVDFGPIHGLSWGVYL